MLIYPQYLKINHSPLTSHSEPHIFILTTLKFFIPFVRFLLCFLIFLPPLKIQSLFSQSSQFPSLFIFSNTCLQIIQARTGLLFLQFFCRDTSYCKMLWVFTLCCTQTVSIVLQLSYAFMLQNYLLSLACAIEVFVQTVMVFLSVIISGRVMTSTSTSKIHWKIHSVLHYLLFVQVEVI